MPKIGSWWLKSHDALSGEEVGWSCFANRTQNSSRAVGGKLFVTSHRILFSPHWLDAVLGGEIWAVNLHEVTSVGVQPKGGDTFGGGLRDRLRVLSAGETDLFVVNGLDALVERLQRALEKARAAGGKT